MKNFCVLPFVNLEARTDGTISPCCIMQDDSGLQLSEGATLSEAWKSKWLKDYRQALRDLPSTTSNPKIDENGHLTNVTWPTKPE